LQEKLKQTTDRLGSTLFRLTWKEQVTPSGRVLPLLRASALPISDTVFSSWPTPRAKRCGKAWERSGRPVQRFGGSGESDELANTDSEQLRNQGLKRN